MKLTKTVKIAMLLGIIVCIGSIILVSRQKPRQEEFKGNREKVTIGITEIIASLIIIGQEQGFFSQEGLDVTTKKYPTGKVALDSMFAREVDMAAVAETPIVFKSFEQQDFSIITALGSSGNMLRIIARKDGGILKPADLRGKIIATQKATGLHFFLHLFLIKNGLSENDVRLSFKKPEELVPELVRGEIDAFSFREPFISEAKKLLGDKAIIFAEPGLYPVRKPRCLQRG